MSNLVKPLLVEFTGVTGSGKTTLVSAVKRHLAADGIVAFDAFDAILSIYGLRALKQPRLRQFIVELSAIIPFLFYILTGEGAALFSQAYRVISKTADSWWVALNLFWNINVRMGIYAMLRHLQRHTSSCRFLISDEGLLQLAHVMFVHIKAEPDLNEVVRFAEIVPKPDALIWVKVETEEVIFRTLQRGHRRAKNKSSTVEPFIKHAEAVYEALFSSATVRGLPLIIENSSPGKLKDNSSSLESRAEKIVQYLQQKYTTRVAHG